MTEMKEQTQNKSVTAKHLHVKYENTARDLLEDLIAQITSTDHFVDEKQHKIRDFAQQELKKELFSQYLDVAKVHEKLKQQCSDDTCLKETNNILECPCVKRIQIILNTYQQLLISNLLWKVLIIPITTITNIYEYQQIMDDFLHIKCIHIRQNPNIGKILCKQFIDEYKCYDASKCIGYQNHYAERLELKQNINLISKTSDENMTNLSSIDIDTDEILMRKQCDMMHCYFVHPWYSKNNKISTQCYVGQKEDEEWIAIFDDCKEDENGYNLLKQKMGGFSYQSAHGFRTGQYKALIHIKPRFGNIKEEVLYNTFENMSSDNWNQTLRKSKVFYTSWARHKIRTLYAGYYRDYISETYISWKSGIEIGMEEIVMIKLYTDFDKLQFELKRCYRYNNKEKKNELIKRLSDFYHWR
eukprot:254494_1